MRKLAVIGHPIAHSKSPIIHQYWLEKEGMEGNYIAIDIAPGALETEIKTQLNQGLNGFNVTIPHKQAIMKQCQKMEATAAAIGAVNTVKVEADGTLHGYNTDAYGFIENIHHHQPHFNFHGKTVMVLGAGGAAKAVLYGLVECGVERIILTNRTMEKATDLAGSGLDKIDVVSWNDKERYLNRTDLLVNTTSLGMKGHNDLEIDLEFLKQGALVTDIVYAPLETNLLKQARLRGYDTVTGIGMLLYQAQKAFEIWTGVLPTVDDALIDKVLA